MDKFDEKSAKACITRKKGKIRGNLIYLKKAGLKVLPAVDYLINHCKHPDGQYYWMRPEEKKS